MGAAATVTVANIITKVLYELRDPDGTNYNKDGAYAELLGYVNRCYELIYSILVGRKSELVRTGTGSFTTAAGTQSYSLTDHTMGDFWTMERIWVSGYEPMDECTIDDLHDSINAEERSETAHRTQPYDYCIIGDYIWFKQVPDDAYNVYLRYFPNFVALTATTNAMPFNRIFNNEIIEGVKMLAKNRNEMNLNVDAALRDIFYDKAVKITMQRRKQQAGFIPQIRRH